MKKQHTFHSVEEVTKMGAERDKNNIGQDFSGEKEQEYFHPEAEELTRTWHKEATSVLGVNVYPNGITLFVHDKAIGAPAKEQAEGDAGGKVLCPRIIPSQYHLRSRDTREYLLPQGKYYLYKDNYVSGLERRLSLLREQGKLENTVIYFGITSDPFFNFQRKFDVTMAALNLFEQFRPGLLVLQTRSPLVISALPTLKFLAENAVVAMPIESRLESVIARYTPGQPKIAERLLAADGLRKQGIMVNLVVSPVLPYGEVHRDAWEFAEMLQDHANYITFGCLAQGSSDDELQLRNLPIARKLVADRQYRFLRPYAFRGLYYACKVLSPEKLLLPLMKRHEKTQLSLFAA